MPGKELRVLHVDDQREWGGGQQQVVYLCEGLRQRGVKSTLCCRSGSALHEKAVSLDIPVVLLPLLGEFDVLSSWRLARIIRDGKYNICHAHTSHSHTLVSMAASRIPGCRAIVSRRVISPRRKNLLSRLKYSCFKVDLYIAISEAVKTVLVSDGVGPDKVTVVHSGILPSRVDDAEPVDLRAEFDLTEDSVVVGNIGSMVEAKGHIFLIRAMPAVLKACPEAYFVIVGEGKERKKLEAEAERLSLRDRLVMTGFRDDALRLLKSFDIYAVSSVKEGLNTSILDALTACRPVVSFSAGGIPEIIDDGHNGVLVETEDIEALANGIIKIAKDKELASELGRKGRATVLDRFTADKMVEGTIFAYRGCRE